MVPRSGKVVGKLVCFVSKYRVLNICRFGFIIDGFAIGIEPVVRLEIFYCQRKLFHGDELVVNIE